jgi:3',5'-cyclic AMP phosphodiesterase CpdA
MASRPALALFSGDMIHDGRLDGVWDRNFFTPARGYFATVPTYYVYGNHENQSPMLDQFFIPAGDARRWSIAVGSVRMIGLDGGMNWTDQSENFRWLDQELARSREKFIFVATHYPPWTSGPHGALNSEGRPAERPIYEGQRYLMPLFEKYQVTAVICGHDHVYERSEPGRVSVIVTGGAGAPLYTLATNAAAQNPYSKVFVKAFHYCHFSVEGAVCRLRALTPEGKVLDEHSWPARSLGGS